MGRGVFHGGVVEPANDVAEGAAEEGTWLEVGVWSFHHPLASERPGVFVYWEKYEDLEAVGAWLRSFVGDPRSDEGGQLDEAAALPLGVVHVGDGVVFEEGECAAQSGTGEGDGWQYWFEGRRG
jgi:hypothetical protein